MNGRKVDSKRALSYDSAESLSVITRGTSLLFAVSVFLSAFLLFQLQPLIGKAILPWFGGTPSVWTTCMLFFQMLLCGGYLYSHLLTRQIPETRQPLVHGLILLISLFAIRVLPDPSWKPAAEDSPVLRIILLLLSTVGIPYFVLSTTGPLLLRWFSRVQPGASPYRLYALSNAGSLLALLSYPFLFEPTMTLSTQSNSWTAGYVTFCGLCLLCAGQARRRAITESDSNDPNNVESQSSNPGSAPASNSPYSSAGKASKVSAKRKPGHGNSVATVLQWFTLSMVASGMLLAETNEVCQDVAVIPFLWVIPLSLYLLSFILCFESDRWYHRRFYAAATAILVLSVCWLQSFGTRMFLPLQLSIYFACLFCICMLCHGELARLRPTPEKLTAFYLTLSAGGAGGGLFVGVIAPMIFPAYWEHYLGLLAACLIAMWVFSDHYGWSSERRIPFAALLTIIVLFVGIGTVFAAAVSNYTSAIAMGRNFYGVLEVEYDDIEEAVVLRHGRILHGLQLKSVPSLPTMYYGFKTGVGLAIAELRERRAPLHMGLVGLGAGTLAAYGQPGDEFRFYEINEQVTKFAQDHFSFLRNCSANVVIVPGDARLMLEREPDQSFDLLVLDAFSGDAIPTHLLTAEAMAVYLRHMKPDGIIAFHISNLHFDLRRITEALAAHSNLSAVTLETSPITDPVTGEQSPSSPGSRWVLMARDKSSWESARFDASRIRTPLADDRRVLWTDDFSNLIEVLLR